MKDKNRQKIKGRVLSSEGSRACVDGGQVGELESLQGSLEEAAVVKAPTTATRDKKVRDGGGEMQESRAQENLEGSQERI